MQLEAVILGAGPAGLAVAHALVQRGAKVKVIEPAKRPGGAIRTIQEDGWVVEVGPNTLQLEGAADVALLQGYGLGDSLQTAEHAAAKRFILAHGKLHTLTSRPSSLFKADLLTWRGKLRLLSEIFRPRGGYAEETIEHFVTRRFGAEAAELLMNPIIAGVHAGDPGRLCMENCFPAIHRLEASHRSIILGLMRQAPTGRQIVGFPQGMQQLADAMAAPLRSEALQLGTMATMIRRDSRGWNVAWRNAQGQDDGATAQHLIITAPHWQWPSLPFDGELKETFRAWERVETPPVTVIARGYDRTAIDHPLDGFGYLVPQRENRAVLGCLFPSTVLPGRAPAGQVLLCAFIGGARQPAIARKSDEELRGLLDRELAKTLGVHGQPRKEWIQRWDQAIPQYGVGQTRREAGLVETETRYPGLHFHGAFRGGISLMQTIRGGHALGQMLSLG